MQALRSADTSGNNSCAGDNLKRRQRLVSTVSHQVMPFRFLLQQNFMSECPLHEDIAAAADCAVAVVRGAFSPLRRVRRSCRSRKRCALYGVEITSVRQAAPAGRTVNDRTVCQIFMKSGTVVL